MPPVRAVFMGSDAFSVPILCRLLDDGPELSRPVHLAGIVTQPDRPRGRGRKTLEGPVSKFARERVIPLLQPEKLRDDTSLHALLELKPQLIVVASFGQLLPRTVLDMPEYGCLNLHPSLLPRYRGPSPVIAPMLHGAPQTGTTLMVMSPRMDAGPIVAQTTIPMPLHATAGELEAHLSQVSAELLLSNLSAWIDGALATHPQNEADATYTTLVSKADGLMDWDRSAAELARIVRAYNPRPTAYSYWRGRQVKLLRAESAQGYGEPGRVFDMHGGAFEIGTGRGSLLVSEVQIDGGKPLNADAFVRGHRGFLGAQLDSDAA